MTFRTTFELYVRQLIEVERRTVGRTFPVSGSFVLCAFDWLHHDFEIGLAARASNAFIPKRKVNIVDEVGKAVTAHRHYFLEFAIDQI